MSGGGGKREDDYLEVVIFILERGLNLKFKNHSSNVGIINRIPAAVDLRVAVSSI
jgi:hypothetical protein